MYYVKLDILLIILVALVPIGFFTTYAIAVFNNHVEPGFPYISDTGTLSPESCIFGQILTFGSFLTFIVVYIRYHHVRTCIKSDLDNRNNLRKFNIVGYIAGLLSCLGISMVGNFQETNVRPVHFIGAAFAFLGLYVYCILQTFLSFKLPAVMLSTKRVLYFRLVIIAFTFVAGVTGTIAQNIANSKFNGINTLKWLPTDGGFAEHVISTACEWAFSIFIMLILASFVFDYKRLKIEHPKVIDYLVESSTDRINSAQNVNYNTV